MLTTIVWQMLKGGGGIIAFSFEQKKQQSFTYMFE